jgi:hypothetical protein
LFICVVYTPKAFTNSSPGQRPGIAVDKNQPTLKALANQGGLLNSRRQAFPSIRERFQRWLIFVLLFTQGVALGWNSLTPSA